MHPFDDAIRLERQPDDSWLGRVSPAYANMVGPFGGITAAVLLNAAHSHPERAGEPVALTVNFAAPIPDGPYTVHARVARATRSTQHWSLELVQGGAVAATGSAVFATRRTTWSAAEAAMPTGIPAAAEITRWPVDGAPPWSRRYDMRFVRGAVTAVDGVHQPDSHSLLWIRDEVPRPLDFLSLAALCDTFYPRIFVRRRRVVPIGTVSMTTFFHADGDALAAQADRFVLGSARALRFRNGFFDQSGEIWSDGGELLASTHQVVYYRE